MKVIKTDNYNRDVVADYLVQENLTKEEADKLAGKLNSELGDGSDWWHIVVADNYVLKRGIIDLV